MCLCVAVEVTFNIRDNLIHLLKKYPSAVNERNFVFLVFSLKILSLDFQFKTS